MTISTADLVIARVRALINALDAYRIPNQRVCYQVTDFEWKTLCKEFGLPEEADAMVVMGIPVVKGGYAFMG